MLSSREIRQQFIDFFVKQHGHKHVPSSPVVLPNDPTLLFANAGMNQFKPYFLGTEQPDHPRAANSQKCIRAGGKHNDLDDVGKDTYHHTFFEMLGNWSFGDYFKQEAIEWAWQLLVDQWGLDPERLHATYFEGDAAEGLEPDDEARQLWKRFLPEARIHPGSHDDNFWEMGDTGPCGPCSEIHYDGTPDKTGGGKVNADDPQVIEIWNLVFIQFNRDGSGKLSPLPARHVDTGMGFERITRILQGKDSNYDTDVFTPIFKAIREVTGAPAYTGKLGEGEDAKIDTAYRVIADHIRTLTIALSDDVHCGNEGRHYVLRRILRRAVYFGGIVMEVTEPFFYKLVPAVVESMGDAFPELKRNPQAVADELKEEEVAFRRTLDRGTQLFLDAAKRGGKQISGEDAFELHTTYGFPVDLTQVMAEERGMDVDMKRYSELWEGFVEASKGGAGKVDYTGVLTEIVQKDKPVGSTFVGYTQETLDTSTWCHLYRLGEGECELVDEAQAGETIALITEKTPFYAEAGGQVADTGTVTCKQGGRLRVRDVQRVGETIFHIGVVEDGPLLSYKRGPRGEDAQLVLEVDAGRRGPIKANHTATHIMNRALRDIVNPEADQKGSLVDEEKTRFDFSHNAQVSVEQLEKVEEQVNRDIAADLPVYDGYAPQEEALRINGLRAVFGEKYPPRVRVVSIGAPVADLLAKPDSERWRDLSIEFCGGTHLEKTGDAEGFVIVSEEGVAKGVRRVTAITGAPAHQAQAQADMLGNRLEALGGASADALEKQLPEITKALDETTLPIVAKVKLREKIGELSKKVKRLQKERARQAAGDVVEVARAIAEGADGNLIVAKVEGADANGLRTAMDVIRKKCPDAAMMLAAADDQKIAFLAAVPQALIKKGLKAGDWVREVAKVAGGGGGGRPDMAQAGGKDPSKLDEALAKAEAIGREVVG